MRECKYILLIFSCQKYHYKMVTQKRGWLTNLNEDIEYFHVIGDDKLTKPYLFDFENHILRVYVQDDYISLPKKVISAYNAINSEYHYDYIFKTDDDQRLLSHVFFSILKNILTNKCDKIHYGGNVVNITKPYLSSYHKIHPELPPNLPMLVTKYCSGRFYFLSELAVKYLLSVKVLIEQEYFEDYAIGFHLNPHLKESMINIETNKHFIDFTESEYVRE